MPCSVSNVLTLDIAMDLVRRMLSQSNAGEDDRRAFIGLRVRPEKHVLTVSVTGVTSINNRPDGEPKNGGLGLQGQAGGVSTVCSSLQLTDGHLRTSRVAKVPVGLRNLSALCA